MKRKIVALTGGIGSGKSTVGNVLRGLGFAVLDCDKISRKVETSQEVLSDVTHLLGEGYVENGQLARGKIRERIFDDDVLYKNYCELFWNRIRDELRRQLENMPATVFVEIAIWNAFEFEWSEIWFVESSEENRIKRVTERDGVSVRNVKNIIARQQSQPDHCRIIVNDGSLEDLKKEVVNAVENLALIDGK